MFLAEARLSAEELDRLRRELDLGDGPVLGFVGSLKTWHGTEVLLRAFAALQPRCKTVATTRDKVRDPLPRISM